MSDLVEDISRNLPRKELQVLTLHKLLQRSAKGHDVSQCAERVVRHCLLSASGTTPEVLSLSLDLLIASPSHTYWVDTLSVIAENLKRHGTNACYTVLRKIPSLPHAALQHLSIYCTTALIECLLNDSSPAIRRTATHAIAAFVLRSRPLTAPSIEAVRLEQLNEEQILVVRTTIERLLFALLQALFDHSDEVAIAALDLLTRFAFEAWSEEPSLLNATKRSTALAIWDILVPSYKKIGGRFASFLSKYSKKSSEEKQTFETLHHLKDVLKALSRFISYILGSKASRSKTSEDAAQLHQQALKWSINAVDSLFLPMCDELSVELCSSACCSVLMMCCYAAEAPSSEKVAAWGIKATRRITRLLLEHDSQVPLVVMVGLVRDGTNSLAALSKNDYVNSKFISSTSVGLLPFAARCPSKNARLEAFSVISSTVVEYDLSGRDSGIGVTMKALLTSESWRGIVGNVDSDSEIASELVCCFSQSLLDASRKIFKCPDPNLRLTLTNTWAVMLSQLMSKTIQCLNWPYSPASAFAKELFLKLFDALGQYSSFLMRSQGVGMEEYERLQEMMVKATLDQQDVGIRASLLVCVTRYWLTSGMKAEANAGHMLKAIWKHIQEHYRDKEIHIKELQTGALWSEAKQGYKTPAQRAVEGGYVSMVTAMSKRTKAVLQTVGTVASAIENTIFGSIALATAASEGSTLTTDYMYAALSSLLALVSQNPPLTEKAVQVLRKYIGIMDEAESSDFIALEAIRNTVSSIEMYGDDYFPKPVAVRDLWSIVRRRSRSGSGMLNDPFAWMEDITESCIFASSRLHDYSRGSTLLSTEEAVLGVSTAALSKMKGYNQATLRDSTIGKNLSVEGDHQTLNGASDPFSVIASHSMDTVKGTALIRVDVLNRSKFRSGSTSVVFSAAGALIPLPDGPTAYALGTIDSGASVTQRLVLSVRKDQGFAGEVYITILTAQEGAAHADDANVAEQPCVPYYVPSSDVLLLRKPARNAGVDVFRRRWDLMRFSISFQVHIRKDQSIDGFIDTLERRSKCLRQVGRMRTYSHVCCLVADSSRGDYVAVAVLAPEARGAKGHGPCVLYVTIRSNSDGYNAAFRDECREWLKKSYKLIFPDEELTKEEKRLAVRPQDAYFITESEDGMSPYQRWRLAHSARICR
ncbi:hypothetical protein BWQ96_05080 [Gracilariopsis chorda]|uniref:Uncharacterized protein n=1 Tax=Gracilariopsis chorda TaxID=448386 RepID=A0A2V3ISV0_9FLOR|nr:hypothetical protein BWQ96_05080 [Gracilariopsis chorda]|eukprot:PXF45179.1 hypothetical protein BWQ96_05080 [Gracilariopsis chorda]